MNNLTIVRLLKCVVLAGALTLSATSRADDHWLDIVVTTPAAVSKQATVSDAGTFPNPLQLLTLSNFDNNATLEFGAGGQSLTVVKALVKMCAPGTGGNLEWLDQGNTAVGVTGTLSATSPTASYSLALGMTGITDVYGASNGTCAPKGAKTYSYTSTAVITKTTVPGGVVSNALTSTYNFWNVAGTVPVAGTLFLLLIGMLGLGWMTMKRRMQDKLQGVASK